MSADFQPVPWDAALEADCARLIRASLEEDLAGARDWTTWAIVDPRRASAADVVVRAAGVVAGLKIGAMVFAEMGSSATWRALVADGDRVGAGQPIASMQGPACDLLTAERTVLNFLCRLSGIATRGARFVEAVRGTPAKVYDTRKTTPGWRRLEKYAVRMGGACNHRAGLYDAVLIKDNHLAHAADAGLTPGQAIALTRQRLAGQAGAPGILEVEVDTLDQLAEVLPQRPDIVLLDNMGPHLLRQAVALRDSQAAGVVLEASGGVTLESIREIAETGVERISVGGLTHSAASLDLGLDWR